MTGARRVSLVVLVVVLVAGAFVGGYAARRVPSTTTSSTTVPVTSTTAPVTPSTSDATWMSLWPDTATVVRYDSPTTVALAFAHRVLRMTSPVAQPFQQGDTRSGEVPIEPDRTGPTTIVLVRQLASDASWWVLGAIGGSVQIDAPEQFATVSSPLRVSGRSTAFEAVVNLALYQDGSSSALAEGTAMGGSMGEMGPYATTLSFASPSRHYGVLVVYTRSAKDGSVLEASAIRVRFA